MTCHTSPKPPAAYVKQKKPKDGYDFYHAILGLPHAPFQQDKNRAPLFQDDGDPHYIRML